MFHGCRPGYITIDEMGSLLPAGGLSILAARPGVGKSAFALSVARYTAEAGDRVLFATLEMSPKDMIQRLAVQMTGMPSRQMSKSAKTLPPEHELWLAIDKAGDLPIEYTRAEVSINQLVAEAKKCHRSGNLSLIVVDYLQLLESDRRGSSAEMRSTEIGEFTRKLKLLARSLQVPVLALSQLNRGASKTDKPKLHHLRESGAIEQDADRVAALHEDEKGNRSFEMLKGRNEGTFDIDLDFHAATMQFRDRPRASFADDEIVLQKGF